MTIEPLRSQEFARNATLETLLGEINDLLGPANDTVVHEHAVPRFPTVLLIGLPRCGSTLLLQWLAASGSFAYPSNLLSRFYAAPAIGARLQLLLTDSRFDYKGELSNFRQKIGFDSALGKTVGGLSPNEFYYFWRRFFPLQVPAPLPDDFQDEGQGARMLAELAAIEDVFSMPFVMKGMLMLYNIPLLDHLFPRLLLVRIRRHPYYVIQSILRAREAFYGDRSAWYSARPPGYEQLRKLDPVRQVAGQVYETEVMVNDAISAVAPERAVTIDYESFTRNPAGLWSSIRERLASQGCEIPGEYAGPKSFASRNCNRMNSEDECAIRDAWADLTGVPLEL